MEPINKKQCEVKKSDDLIWFRLNELLTITTSVIAGGFIIIIISFGILNLLIR